jgi:hypothetical protein
VLYRDENATLKYATYTKKMEEGSGKALEEVGTKEEKLKRQCYLTATQG